MMMTTLGVLGWLMGQMMPGQGMGGGIMGGWGFGMVLWALFWVAVLLLVVVVAWRLLQGRGSARAGGVAPGDPQATLRPRRDRPGGVPGEEAGSRLS